VLILLPPSENKNQAPESPAVSLDNLSFAEHLTKARIRAISEHDPSLFEAATSSAIDLYSGVLYKSLEYKTLSATAKRRADSQIIIISALFGALRLQDQVPLYKAKIKSSHWKLPLAEALEGLDSELVIDCRSSTYSNVWKPNPLRTVAIRVFQEKAGERSIITHMSKKYRGEFTRLLLRSKTINSPEALYSLASKNYDCELHPPHSGNPWFLDLIIHL